MVQALEPHEWLSFRDEDSSLWLFDTTFLVSNYSCIYGAGCPSIEPEPDPSDSIGCCPHGAHFVDAEDVEIVEAKAALLSDDEWQFASVARANGGAIKKKGKKNPEWMTKRRSGACIFLNRAGFRGGAGCALHLGAVAREERPIDWKPAVCWQVPIRLDIHTNDYGEETFIIRAWRRADWGPGGEDFGWWCTEEPAAYSAANPVYKTSRDELIELCGEDLYKLLAAELDERIEHHQGSLSSPVVRKPTPVTFRSHGDPVPSDSQRTR